MPLIAKDGTLYKSRLQNSNLRVVWVHANVAVRPPRGCAVVHRQGTVLHAGGAVTEGTKHIMQFFLYYEEKPEPEPRHMTNLRWGA